MFVTFRRACSAVAAASLGISVAAAVAVATAAPASAAVVPGPVSPVANRDRANGVTADALPTAQMDGVAWSQAIVGNTVWVGGSFANARPAGAAAGTQQVTRNNLLEYDITTGNLITPTTPANLNAQVKAVTASPDGTRVYVGGQFTTADGVTHNRIAAFDAASGALISTFAPSLDSSVYAIAATNQTVYVGGTFSRANGQPRAHLAAFSASNGALLSTWAPATDQNVTAMVMTPDGQKVVIGGSFTTLNGATAKSLAAVDPVNGLAVTWNVGNVVQDTTPNASILSLATDANGNVYGSGEVFGASGNLEGSFSANQTNGDINWIEDCHGDTYSVSASPGGFLYAVGHSHYCGNIGGFPQTSPTWTFHRAIAFTTAPTGWVQHNSEGNYHDWSGYQSPSLVNWFPDLAVGTVTGKTQAAWSVASNSKYVVLGGEFPKVNNQAQQGLVRFAVASSSTNKRGPQLYSAADTDPSVISVAPGTARVSIPANWDQDDMALTYKVYRDSLNNPPVYTSTQNSTFWNRPNFGFTDTGLTPGQTYQYKVVASDPDGNKATSPDWVSVTVAGGGTQTAYASDVTSDGASHYWRLGEPTGTTAYDSAGFDDMTEYNAVTHGIAGAINGDADTASSFDGTSAYAATSRPVQGPNVFSIEAWFKTTSTKGGKIVGFGNSATANSTSYDRHIYMDAAGHVLFGVYNNASYTISTAGAFNDGTWHHAVGTLSSNGMAFYVDGKRVGTNSGTTVGQSYSGYWRVGGDSTWSGSPYFNGAIDDVAIYPTALTPTQVRQHFTDSGRTLPGGTTPTDTYGKAITADSPDLYYRLGDNGTNTAADSSGNGNTGTYFGAITKGVSSPVTGTSDTAATFSGTTGSDVASNVSFNNPRSYSEELWFNTTTNKGGKLIGFGSSQTGTSKSFDRHVYMETNGKLTFGAYNGAKVTITSPNAYNDGQWHYMVATEGVDGMKLYVDNALVASNPNTASQAYTGYWRIGGDATWNNTTYFAGTIDEAAVYPAVLSAAQIATHYKASTFGPQNQKPVAAFTATPTDLSVSVDGSGSHDPDGSIASYSWNWGDQSTDDSGVQASHNYAQGGQYTITLTVTDNDGGQTTLSQPVTVVAPNQNPTASFIASPNGLTVSVDGSGSHDPDGSIAAYSWNWGDGSPADSGQQASHTYASPGTKTITLTVTDDRNGQDTATQQVTIAAGTVAADAFNRTASSQWGSADIGGPWTTTGSASRFSVDGSVAKMQMPIGATDTAMLNAVSQQDVNMLVDVSPDQVATGTGLYATLIARRIGTSDYRLTARLMPGGVVHLSLSKTVSGKSTSFGERVVSGLSYAAGDVLRMRFTAITQGASTALAGTIWNASGTEPAAPQFTTTDSEATLQAPGAVGLSTYFGSTGTAAMTASYDNLSVKSA